MPADRTTRRLLTALIWAAILSPALVYLLRLPSFGTLQNNDYYGVLGSLVDGDELSRDPMRWLTLKSNEHRATLPALVYVANIALFDGSNRPLAAFSVLLMALTLVPLLGLLPSDLRASPGARLLFGVTVAIFCFTPVAAHNVAMGFSGTMWLMSNAFAAAAIAALAHRAHRARVAALWPAVLFAFLAAFSYSTSLSLWPALVVGALYLRLDLRRVLFLAAASTLALSLFVLSYEPPVYHPDPNLQDLSTLWRYVSIYLGLLFTDDPNLAALAGRVALTASVLCQCAGAFLCGRHPTLRRDLAPWVMVQLFAFGNAVGTAVGRSGFGEHQALASRYATLVGLFWAGLLVSSGLLVWRFGSRRAVPRWIAATASVALLTLLAVPMYRRGDRQLDAFEARARRQGRAALAIRCGVRDPVALRNVTPASYQVWRVAPYLRRVGHVPFDRRCRLGETIDGDRVVPRRAPHLRGFFERRQLFRGRVHRVSGWALDPTAEIDEILLLDEDLRVRGEAALGERRADVGGRLGAAARYSGWEGYAELDPTRERVEAYVRFAGDEKLYLLPMRRRLEANWEKKGRREEKR